MRLTPDTSFVRTRTGWDRHASRTRKRRLPWHLSFHDQPQPTPAILASSQSDGSITGNLSSGGLYSSVGGRGGSGSLSTTSKKTMESLSTSVYDELQPFRRAHRTLIKVVYTLRTIPHLHETNYP